MQQLPISPLSNQYIPNLMGFIRGNNETFMHRMMGNSVNGGIKNFSFNQPQNQQDTDGIQIAFNIILFGYIIIGLSHLIDDYLMPCLENLSFKFQLSQTSTGILVALGISLPELTTNTLSVFSSKPEMIGYGLGTILGSGVFGISIIYFTLCFGITSIYSNFVHKQRIKFNLLVLLRDIYIYLITLGYLVLVSSDGDVGLVESGTMVLLWPLYIYYSLKYNTNDEDIPLDQDQTQVPFQRAYESFQLHRQSQYSRLDMEESNDPSESRDDELENLINQRKDTKSKKNNLNKQFKKFMFKIKTPFRFIYKKSIPFQTNPIGGFIMIMVYIFLFVKVIIHTVDDLVGLLPLTHTFVGLTFACWGGNVSDIMNACIAAKNQKIEFVTSSIIGSQILNLQISLGLPWLLSNIIYERPIELDDNKIYITILVTFIVTILSVLIILLNGRDLSYRVGVQLIIIYLSYCIFEFYNQK